MIRVLLIALVVAIVIVHLLIGEHATDTDPETAAAIERIHPPYASVAVPTTTSSTTTTTVARARTAPTIRAASAAPAVIDGAWSCGGDLPPCWVMDRENPQRDLTVYNGGAHHEPGYTGGNPEGDSTASGKWQFLRSTWNGFMGYVNAADAPWEVQDAKARQLWAGGRGCSHWAAC
jgi:hypothetical protein